jgi:hypothetical protein
LLSHRSNRAALRIAPESSDGSTPSTILVRFGIDFRCPYRTDRDKFPLGTTLES